MADQGSVPAAPAGTGRPPRAAGRPVRLKDVAARAGVSAGLASPVLRNQPGLPVPGCVSVVGYDDSMLARLARVDLTTISQDAPQQARQAIELAVDRLENGRPAPREVVITPRLVVRRTTAPPAGTPLSLTAGQPIST
jgi:DNA-binding LacI/PurR family transcriptional regulator